jgi:hypothetical protein
LRKPQDYFRRAWSTGFRAADRADTANTVHQDNSENTDDQEACEVMAPGAVAAITMFSSSFSTAGPTR